MYQSITIVGNLGKDPEMRYIPSGTAVTNLNVATNRKYTGADGQVVKETTWFRVSVFGKQAEACAQYLKKGGSVLVEGRLQSDPKTGGPKIYTKQDGSMGASFEISASTVRFLSSKNEGQPNENGATESTAENQGQPESTGSTNSTPTEEIPF